MDFGTILKRLGQETISRDLLDALQEYRERYYDLTEKIEPLRNRVRQLEEQLDKEDRMRFDSVRHAYFLRCGNTEEGPLCPSCWGSERKIGRIWQYNRSNPSSGGYCSICNKNQPYAFAKS